MLAAQFIHTTVCLAKIYLLVCRQMCSQHAFVSMGGGGIHEESQIDEHSCQHIFNLLLKYTSQQNRVGLFSNQGKKITFYWTNPLNADFGVAAQIALNTWEFLVEFFERSPQLSVELFQAIFTTENVITQLS